MIRLGRVMDNKMVDMKLSNAKLVDRGAKMLKNMLKLPLDEARELLLAHGSVRRAMEEYKR
jgi:N-acetylmuramic acid 6-phosphate etherase